jgi:DNA-directed RNA polymerase delta subunit
LERIGQDYNITRERVRQIISDVLRRLVSDGQDRGFENLEEQLIFVIDKNNGIIKENDIVKAANSDGFKEANAIKFVAQCSRRIISIEKSGIIERSWVTNKETAASAERLYAAAKMIFEKNSRPMADGEISVQVSEKMPDYSQAKVISYLKSCSFIKKNNFGKWGLVGWEEITPKGAREKIYLVLKETGSPLHFTRIAELIDKHSLGNRKAHPQTIHNELIKDDRFILIGRGIYALSEWGYREGTIKDVLRTILKESERPMSKEDILAAVMKIRQVKKATVMINLNNAKVFERENNLYTIKK